MKRIIRLFVGRHLLALDGIELFRQLVPVPDLSRPVPGDGDEGGQGIRAAAVLNKNARQVFSVGRRGLPRSYGPSSDPATCWARLSGWCARAARKIRNAIIRHGITRKGSIGVLSDIRPGPRFLP